MVWTHFDGAIVFWNLCRARKDLAQLKGEQHSEFVEDPFWFRLLITTIAVLFSAHIPTLLSIENDAMSTLPEYLNITRGALDRTEITISKSRVYEFLVCSFFAICAFRSTVRGAILGWKGNELDAVFSLIIESDGIVRVLVLSLRSVPPPKV